MRVLLVSRGFRPAGGWGTETYSRELAFGLVGRGHEVAVLHVVDDGSKPRYTVEESATNGVRTFAVHNVLPRRKRLVDSYVDARLEDLFRGVVERFEPALVHFLHLVWGLSARLPIVCRERGVPSLMTVADLGLVCHRGQMFDHRLRACGGPHPPETCARCIRTAAPFDHHPALLLVRRAAAACAAALSGAGERGGTGGLGGVVRSGDVARREQCMRACVDALDGLVVPSAALEDVLLRWGVAPEKLTRLVYGVDEEALTAVSPVPDRTTRFGFLGQFAPHKGLHVLVEAARRMRHRLPESVEPWHVHLYGAAGGPRHRLYAERVLPRPGEARFTLEGRVDRSAIPGVLARLDALVLPSLWIENAPLVALQARAVGLPIIGSDVPGVAPYVARPEHGRLVPPGDAGALADALRAFVLDRRRERSAPAPVAPYVDHLASIEALYGRHAQGQRPEHEESTA